MQLAGFLKLQPNHLSLCSIFVGHGNLRYAGAEYLAYHNMSYDLYLMPSDLRVLDANCNAFGSDVKIGSSVQRPSEQENEDNIFHIGGVQFQ